MFRKIKNEKLKKRLRRKMRIRNRIHGSKLVPRVTVFRSNRHIFAQAIDDENGSTLCSASTYGKNSGMASNNVENAKKVGEALADKLLGLKIEQVVFDRNGYLYHGKVAAVAEGMREKKIRF